MAPVAVSVSLDELRVGSTCSYPIAGDGDVVLVAANVAITQHIINGLRDRGFSAIYVDPRDLAALRGTGKKKDAKPKVQASLLDSALPVKQMLVDRFADGLSPERAAKISKCIESAKDRCNEMRSCLQNSSTNSTTQPLEISDGLAQSIVDDHDQTIGAIGSHPQTSGVELRSVQMSTLGMAVAAELGLNGPQMLEVGMVGLLHDISLHAMDPQLSGPLDLLSSEEWWEYQKHPVQSFQCVEGVLDVSNSVLLAIQQVHEQFDGTGFPRGLKAQRIHMHARILNVVDAYLQLTSPPAGRIGIVPHDAMGLLLHKASQGLFDPQVIRAFLSVKTLFPLGSLVELTSGDIARVIRRPRRGFAAPVVMGSDGARVELESGHLKVRRPVCDPNGHQKRLSKEDMQAHPWHPAMVPVVAL